MTETPPDLDTCGHCVGIQRRLDAILFHAFEKDVTVLNAVNDLVTRLHEAGHAEHPVRRNWTVTFKQLENGTWEWEYIDPWGQMHTYLADDLFDATEDLRNQINHGLHALREEEDRPDLPKCTHCKLLLEALEEGVEGNFDNPAWRTSMSDKKWALVQHWHTLHGGDNSVEVS